MMTMCPRYRDSYRVHCAKLSSKRYGTLWTLQKLQSILCQMYKIYIDIGVAHATRKKSQEKKLSFMQIFRDLLNRIFVLKVWSRNDVRWIFVILNSIFFVNSANAPWSEENQTEWVYYGCLHCVRYQNYVGYIYLHCIFVFVQSLV